MAKKLTNREKERRAKEKEVLKALGPGEKRKKMAAAKRNEREKAKRSYLGQQKNK